MMSERLTEPFSLLRCEDDSADNRFRLTLHLGLKLQRPAARHREVSSKFVNTGRYLSRRFDRRRHRLHAIGRHIESRAYDDRALDCLPTRLVDQFDCDLAAWAVADLGNDRFEDVVRGGGKHSLRTEQSDNGGSGGCLKKWVHFLDLQINGCGRAVAQHAYTSAGANVISDGVAFLGMFRRSSDGDRRRRPSYEWVIDRIVGSVGTPDHVNG